MDPNQYGPVSMVSDEAKLATQPPMIKDERLKESPSPNDISKSQMQVNTQTKYAINLINVRVSINP